jgi:NDP-sugar pyrophosphorylase family protein
LIGMILCGGLGKRLRPATETLPKVLLELKPGYTILERQLFQYKSAGIDRVILLTAHLGEKIRKKFGDRHMGVELRYVQEKTPMGTLNAIRLGMEEAREDAVISNGDVLADLNVRRMGEKWKRSGLLASIFVVRMPSPYGVIDIRGGRIVGFREKPILKYHINGGFYCMSKKVLPLLEKYMVGDIERTAFPELARKGKLGYYREDVPFWISVDTEKDLETARREYSNRTDKPWGYEKLLGVKEGRMEKILYIMAGYRTSMHYHERREEVLKVISGRGWVIFKGNSRKPLRPGVRVRLRPGTVHSFVAASNLLLHESSTHHPEDIVRVEDYYGFRIK